MMLRSLRFATAVAGLTLLCATAAVAATVSYTTSVPLSTTDWATSASVPKFDATLGCLSNICFTLNGHVEGDAKFESLDMMPATVATNLAATLTLSRPDFSTLVLTIPVVAHTDNITAFDGVVDFAGTSGKTYSGIAGDKADSSCTASATDYALFTGTGNIVLPFKAEGISTATGAGNLAVVFATKAAALVTVTYTYDICATPVRSATWGTIKGLFR